MSNVVSMKQLLEAGVHFGHPTRKWDPKMKKYIYTSRNDIYIINLEKTVDMIDDAYAFVKEMAASGKPILFVGTKKQAQEAIMQEATKCGMYYINSRWLGGTLTNYSTIRTRIERLNKLNQMEKMNEFNVLPKKEVSKLVAERDKLEENLGGIKDMRGLPGALFVVDPKKEHLAVEEARKLHIPIVAIVDTNCDPDKIDYVIPGNDDAIRSIKLIAGVIANAVIEAREGEEGLALRLQMEEEMKSKAKAAASPMEEALGLAVEPTETVEKVEKVEPVEKVEEAAEAAPAPADEPAVVEEETAAEVEA